MTRLERVLAELKALLGCTCTPRCYHGKAMHSDDCELVARWLS